jgi:Ca2+-transporting ATPase
MPLPLLPLQILWINLVTDGPPALALGLEPAERGVMRRPPFPTDESLFSRGVGIDILWIGLVTGISSLGLGYYFYSPDEQVWQTMIFTTLTFAQMALALTVRSHVDSFFRIGPFSNLAMLGAVALTTVLQLIVVYVPFMQSIFSTVPLSAAQLGLCVALGSVVFWAVELEKLVRRWRAPRAGNEENEESTPARSGSNS